MYIDKKGRKQYTRKEKLEFHAKQSKKGAKDSKGKPVSDFQRGVHSAKFGFIAKRKQPRKKKATKNEELIHNCALNFAQYMQGKHKLDGDEYDRIVARTIKRARENPEHAKHLIKNWSDV